MKKIKLYYIEYSEEIVFYAGERCIRLNKHSITQEQFERQILNNKQFELISLL